MERQELLSQFNELLGTYANHKAFAEKAKEQATSFSSAVIEKVIADHQIKASMVADQIAPLLPQLAAEVAQLVDAMNAAEASKGDLGARIEELELRKLIGEISDEEYDAQSSEGRETVSAADEELATLGAQRDEIQGALDKWQDLSGTVVEVSAPDEPAAENATEADVEDDEDDDLEVVADHDDVVDAILPGFEEAEGVDESVEIEQDDIEAEEAVAFDVADDEDAVDVVPEEAQEPAAVDVQIDDSGVDEIGVEPSEEASLSDLEEAEARRAILLSNEGTPDEQIYALTGDVFTIGRGRDNDLQIKNDSKVSRFHCKLYRRAANYYLEDNKSSNGTMVNGELISERRLFGGEELVIGETFFRFRVM